MNTALIENGVVVYVWNNDTFDEERTKNHIQTDDYIECGMTYDGKFHAQEKKEEDLPLSEKQVREEKIIKALGAEDKMDAIVKQLNLINESIASGDNTKVKEVDTIVKQILNS